MTHETLRKFILSTTLVAVGALTAGCSTIQTSDNEPAKCTNWQDDIGPLFASHCSACHSGSDAPADYRTTSYSDVIAWGADGQRTVVAGDPNSLLLQMLTQGDATHELTPDARERVREWAVNCDLAYSNSLVHDRGLMDPSSSEFHGALLRNSQWNFGVCASCHGDDFSGGAAEASCLDCHADGPKACDVCHGSTLNTAPPRALDSRTATTEVAVGAHQQHLVAGTLHQPVECSECHVVPQRFEDPGHVFRADGSIDPLPAEVIFGSLAGRSIDDANRAGPPSWDRSTKTCGNVYCHGDALADDAGSNTTPDWTSVGSGQADCGTCHGRPPASHASDTCSNCHGQVINSDEKIAHFSLHINGVVEVGNGGEGCSACHGSIRSAAPPNDLAGNVDNESVGVGAHDAHVFANRFRGPIPCGECHLMPGSLNAPGHIDTGSPAEVFPDEATFGTLAAADGAMPIWDRNTTTCSSVYCHGGGTQLQEDKAAGLIRSPSWVGSDDRPECGTSCHATPPEDTRHATYGAFACSDCHTETVDASGAIIFDSSSGLLTSKHINGEVDVWAQ